MFLFTFLGLVMIAFAKVGLGYANTDGDASRNKHTRPLETSQRVVDEANDREVTTPGFVRSAGRDGEPTSRPDSESEASKGISSLPPSDDADRDSASDSASASPSSSSLIVVITPTYARPTNKPPPQPNALLSMLNAMCQSAFQNVLWVLVIIKGDKDPAPRLPKCVPGRHTTTVHAITIEVEDDLVSKSNASMTGQSTNHSRRLSEETSATKKESKKKKKMPPHRGVAQRNAGLAFVRDRERFTDAIDRLFPFTARGFDENSRLDPLVYFGDDDNEYDPSVFEEIGKIRNAGVWPVGFPFAMAPIHVEAPSVRNGVIVGYLSKFCDRRRYSVDMAGFAMRVSVSKNATFSRDSKTGHLEDDFLRSALGEDALERNALEPMASGATQILVWHLGWKFDRDKGKWGVMYEVSQPAEVMCKSDEEQTRILRGGGNAVPVLANKSYALS